MPKLTDKQEAAKRGRPPKYETPEQMQAVIDLYFLACKSNQAEALSLENSYLMDLDGAELDIINAVDDIVPTVSGLAYILGMTTQAFRDYEKKDDFLCTVKRAKQRVEMSLEQRLANPACTGSIFSLKNNFGWKDKSEQELTGKDGGPIETRSVINFIPVSREDDKP